MTVPLLGLTDSASGHYKPLDFGGYGITGSVDAVGGIIAVNAPHPLHGYVTLTTASPFPEKKRYDPAAVRAYRAGLVALSGFGFRLAGEPLGVTYGPFDVPLVQAYYRYAGGTLNIETGAVQGEVFQRVVAEGEVPIWSGTLALMRCAYTQLTEGGPLPMPDLRMIVAYIDGILTIENPALPFAVVVDGFPANANQNWSESTSAPVAVKLTGQLGETLLRFRFGLSVESIIAENPALRHALLPQPLAFIRETWASKLDDVPQDPLLRRGLTYSAMLAVPDTALNRGGGVCLLTDHMLLPLSWNRDAYYMARALLAWRANQIEAADIVRRHLIWMFESTEIVDGFWGRCYLANGRVKDQAFQLDQQIYPLLELADYTIITGNRALLHKYQPQVAQVLSQLGARRLEKRWLIPTDETPGDDPIAQPYHFSSHVLFWHMVRRLAQAGAAQPRETWQGIATALHEEIWRSFVTDWKGQPIFAYATDGAGNYHRYHDANDVPVALAPAWGLCAADNLLWRKTIDFAFSPDNAGGYYNGQLGSVHTRAPWPLGDVQDWIVARAIHDPVRAERAKQRLHRAAQWDGALPEAYDQESGAVYSRHWFSWANAVYACAALGVFDPPRPNDD